VKRVVLTRESPRNDELRDVLSATFTVFEVPATFTEEYSAAEVCVAFDALHMQPATIVVTSARSARALAAVLANIEVPPTVVAIGPATLRALEHVGLHGATMAPEASATAVGSMPLVTPILSVGAEAPRPELTETIAQRGLSSTHLVAYRTVPRTLSEAEQRLVAEADAIVVAAPSAWRVVKSLVPPTSVVVVPGETTAGEVRATHGRVVVAATTQEIQHSLASSI
jgi:uroporphyrinogen-III synthase